MSDQDHWVGDPRVAWTPTISARCPDGLDAATLLERLALLRTRLRPDAGPTRLVTEPDLDALLRTTSRRDVAAPLGAGLGAGRLAVSVDHAVSDGLGLLAALTELTGVPLSSNARGVGDRAPRYGFAAAAGRRLAEVVWSPPAVVRPTAQRPAGDDVFAARPVEGAHGTAAVVAAAARACADDLVPPRQRRRVRVAVGLSTVNGQAPRLHDDSALMRLDPVSTTSVDAVREALRSQGIEPPPGDATGSSQRPWLARLTVLAEGVLASRLGSTVLVSHLGTVTGALTDLAFYPVTGGGSGLAIGAVVQDGRTMLTARARGAQHDPAGLRQILDAVADRMR